MHFLALSLALILLPTAAEAVIIRDEFPASWQVVIVVGGQGAIDHLAADLKEIGRFKEQGLVWWEYEEEPMLLPYVYFEYTTLDGLFFQQADLGVPAPEPATLLLCGTGAALAGVVHQLRRRRPSRQLTMIYRAIEAVLLLGITSLSGTLADAQPAKRTPVVGVLGTNPPTTPFGAHVWSGFALGLSERGWVEGKNVRIERRWSDGRAERFPELAAELVRLGVDLLFTATSQATKAAMDATDSIPIVFVVVADPVGAGFVKSLASPGGNVTGVTNQFGDIAGKWLQLAKDVKPGLRHIGIMWNPADPGSALSFKDSQSAFARLGINLTSVPIKAPDDFGTALDTISRERPGFLIVHPSPVIFRQRQRIGDFAVQQRIPTGTGTRAGAEDGSFLLSYGPDVADILRQGARYVDRVLKGARPADLPVEQPTRFELVINLKTAKAIGLTIPQSLVQQADLVIE